MLHFAIVGTGRISDWVLKGALQDKRFKAVAVCSRSEEHALSFIAGHPEVFDGEVRIFTSIDELAKAPDIDAVYIGTPNTTHLPYSLPLLRAGKHVLCEKPLACNAQEVEEMIAAAGQGNAVLMEAMISTLNPNFLKARNMMSQIGPVRHYSSSFCQYSSRYEALKSGIVSNSFNPKMGGGALADVGIYVTYPLIVLFGEPDSVHSELVTMPTQFGNTIIQGIVSLRYNEMTANLCYSKACDMLSPTEICGEGGNIQLDSIHICRQLTHIPHQAPSSGRGEAAKPLDITQALDKDEYYYEFKEFIDIIESGKMQSGINSLQNSLANRRLMDAIGKA